MNPATHFDPVDITAAILAGGEGRRVGGRDKGLITLAGKPLVAHVVAGLAGQVGQMLICSNRNDIQYAAFAKVCADTVPGFRGPLAGIAAALAACETCWLLTVPVDSPQPPPDLARSLHAAASIAQANAAVVNDGERRQPLFALYRRELAGAAAQALSGDLPVWRWQSEIGAVDVDFSDMPKAFLNLNTDEDFRDWEQQHG